MRPSLQDPLEGCVLSSPTKWTGQLRLEQCPSEQRFQLLCGIPGVVSHEVKRSPEDTGWFVPQSLADMGQFPATIGEYPPDPQDVTPSGLHLHRYEARAVTCCRQVTAQREGMMIAGDPGLGKSIIALHALHLDGYLQRPGLIIGPNIAKGVWCDEDSDAFQHYGLRVTALEGVKNIDTELLKTQTTVFCHYELLHAWQAWIVGILRPAWMLIDESHFLTNQKAQRSRAAQQVTLLASIERRYALTGTPLPNTRMDLWCQLSIVQPRQWGPNSFAYGIRYCGGHREEVDEGGQGGHWLFDGESNDIELKARLAGTFLRFTTEEVQNELPPMERHVIEADCRDAQLLDEYSLAQRDISGYLKQRRELPTELATLKIGNATVELKKEDHKAGAVRLVCLSTLIGILSKMKQEPALRAIDDIMQVHDRLVVFTWRVSTAEWLHAKLSALLKSGGRIGGKCPAICGPVHGEMPMSERKELARVFAGLKQSIFVATMGSAGTSINSLSAASACLLVDLHWNTVALQQAEKRVYRDGTKAAKIDIYYLVLRQTVDDMFLEKIKEKATRAASIASQDTGGLSLVRDLIPDSGGASGNIDQLCSRLMAMD